MTDYRYGDFPRNPRLPMAHTPRKWGKIIDLTLSITALILFGLAIAELIIGWSE